MLIASKNAAIDANNISPFVNPRIFKLEALKEYVEDSLLILLVNDR